MAMSRREYDNLVRRLRRAVTRALPVDSTVLVASKGDPRLVSLDCRAVWHFPSGASGGWAGHHPADSEWVIEQLEAMQARGAEYLVLPATSFWWLAHYETLAEWLGDHCPVVFEDPRTCAIFSLGPYPAFYGRERDDEVNRHLHPVAPAAKAAAPERRRRRRTSSPRPRQRSLRGG
jgi:hypothetical protein